MWALARLGHHPGRMLAGLDPYITARIPEMTRQGVSNLLWALAVLQARLSAKVSTQTLENPEAGLGPLPHCAYSGDDAAGRRQPAVGAGRAAGAPATSVASCCGWQLNPSKIPSWHHAIACTGTRTHELCGEMEEPGQHEEQRADPDHRDVHRKGGGASGSCAVLAECERCGARQAMQLPTFQLLLDRMSELYSANMSVIQLAQVRAPPTGLHVI